MFDFIPSWLTALISCVTMVAIGVAGIKLTNHKSDSSSKDSSSKKE